RVHNLGHCLDDVICREDGLIDGRPGGTYIAVIRSKAMKDDLLRSRLGARPLNISAGKVRERRKVRTIITVRTQAVIKTVKRRSSRGGVGDRLGLIDLQLRVDFQKILAGRKQK